MSGSTKTISRAGFTIIELALGISVLGILIIGLLGASTYYFSVISRNSAMVDMTVNSQNLLRSTVEELRYGSGVKQSNTIVDANAPLTGWNTSNNNFVIIIAVPAVDGANEYIIDPATGSPYNNELVYFKSGTTLYKRSLSHPDAAGNKLTTSCPSALATPACPADKQLGEHVKSMVFTLYNQDDAITVDPLLARSVRIDLALERNTFADPLALDTSIRITLRNNF